MIFVRISNFYVAIWALFLFDFGCSFYFVYINFSASNLFVEATFLIFTFLHFDNKNRLVL